MKIIAAAPCVLFTIALFGCSQQASNAPAIARPTTASSDTNTFGESKDDGASNAERARAANYGSDSAAASTTAPK
jgi:hypothetical protein